jgi:hypothetical protein
MPGAGRRAEVHALDSAEAGEWDAWLDTLGPEAGFLQTTAWAAINEAANRATSQLVVARDERGTIAGGALLSLREGRLDCFEGPVLGAAERPRTLAAVLDGIGRAARQQGASSVMLHGRPPASSWWPDEELAGVLARRRYEATPWLTALVDLRPPEDELLAGFQRSARKAIRRCAEMGVEVFACDTLDSYLACFVVPYHGPDEGAEPYRADRAMWERDPGRHYRFFAARDGAGGAILGTLGTYAHGGVATEIMSRRTEAGVRHGAPVQDALHWAAFRAHQQSGDTLFNLAGFAPTPRSDKEAGIRRFKEKWNGQTVPVPRFELTRGLARRGARAVRTMLRT